MGRNQKERDRDRKEIRKRRAEELEGKGGTKNLPPFNKDNIGGDTYPESKRKREASRRGWKRRYKA